MKRLRLLLVSYRFWPLAGEREVLAGALAEGLAEIGHDVTVASAGIVKQWPDEFQLGNVCVRRLSLSNRLAWAATAWSQTRNRWIRSLQRWFASRTSEFDGVIVFEFAQDQLGVSKLLAKSGLPMAVRVDDEIVNRFAREIAAVSSSEQGAIHFVANAAETCNALSQIAPRKQICQIEDGVAIETGPSFSKASLRQSLASTHAVLAVAPSAPFAICSSAISHNSGVFRLVRIWPRIVSHSPNAKLWLIGDGPDKDELFQRICDLNLRNSVILPGEFDEIRDVLQAANMFIIPGSQERLTVYAKLAMSLGVPLICHRDAPCSRNLRDEHNAFLYEDQTHSLSEKILQCIDDWALKRHVVLQARMDFSSAFSVKTMADKYRALFDPHKEELQIARETEPASNLDGTDSHHHR